MGGKMNQFQACLACSINDDYFYLYWLEKWEDLWERIRLLLEVYTKSDKETNPVYTLVIF